MKENKLLFVGSFAAEKFFYEEFDSKNYNDLNVSGTVLSLKNTYEDFLRESKKRNTFNLTKFDTNIFRSKFKEGLKNKYFWKVYNIFKNYAKLLFLTYKSDKVLINTSPHGLAYLSFVVVFSCILRKKCVLRIFGGRDPFDVQLYLKPFIFSSFLSSSSIGVQVKSLTNKYKKIFSDKVFWLPTSRKSPEKKIIEKRKKSDFRGSFFYLGHIRKDKGIKYLIKAFSNQKLSSYKLNLYGPLWGQLGEKEIFDLKEINNSSNIFYHGTVYPNKVFEIIASHDTLIFPTISPAEGYPGVVIESLLVGTPVLASNWLHLPEILNENNSILFEPFSYLSIIKAVQKYSESKNLQQKLNIGALKSSESIFSLDKQSKILLKKLEI